MAQWKYGRFQASKMEKTSRFFELEISRYSNGGGCFSCEKLKKSTKIKAQIPEQDLAIHTIHFVVSCVLHRFTMQEIYNWKLSLDLDIQTQLNFEISNGQQNSFTAEPALVQRRLASTLSWPHYKFKCSEIHRQMNQVHMPDVCISYWAELALQQRCFKCMSDPSGVCNRERFSHMLPLYLERHKSSFDLKVATLQVHE